MARSGHGRPGLPDLVSAVPGEARDLRRAWSDIVAGRAARGLERLQKLGDKHPTSAAIETATGFALLARNDRAEARATFARALIQSPAFAAALMGAAAVEYRDGKLDAALA